jgi:hypothetical protein
MERYDIIQTSIHQWYGVHGLVSPYSDTMAITPISSFCKSDSSRADQPITPEAFHTRFLTFSYRLAPKLHQWFVDENIEYKLRFADSRVEILLNAEIAALVRLIWAGYF